ncbi:MAG: glycosyltransferase family 2 protein [Ignavibacteria bacterium]|nr:glycosyltransferase family 2 protein [Ignavibacteria bacterium]
MTPLSVIIITRDEERNIAACLDSVAWADDLVVVDAASADRTADIARERGARVFIEEWRGFSAAKTFALAQTRNAWVLWLDADERVTPGLADELRAAIADPAACAAYRMPRKAYFLGTWIRHCGWYPGHVTRLFRADAARFSDAKVHEALEVRGSIGTLRGDLLHFTDDNLEHYFAKLNRYTSLAADELHGAGKRGRLRDLLLRPAFVFFKMYLLKAGFLDGLHGYVLCRLSANYVFAKYAKLWERGA